MTTRILFTVAALLVAISSKAQIVVTGGSLYLRDGDYTSYYEPNVYVSAKYYAFTGNISMTCTVVNPSVDEQETIEVIITAVAADVDVYTGSGATDSERFMDSCEQYIIEYFKDIAANSPLSFSH